MPNFLMIKTHDKRKIITDVQNLSCLEKFLKTFQSEVFLIQAPKTTKSVDLNKLVNCICDSTVDMPLQDFKIKSQIYPKTKNKTNIVKEYIENTLSSNEILTIKKVKEKYSISDASIYNQFKIAKQELEQRNLTVIKIGAGKYCLFQTKS